MIRQMKLSIKLMRYTFGIKVCVVCEVLFFVAGILLSFISVKARTPSMGGFFMILTGLWLSQLFLSLGSARMVQASPWNKPIQTTMGMFISFLGFAASYVVIILLKLPYLATASAGMLQNMSAEFLLDALLTMIMMLYCGAAYKYLITSTIIFFLAYLGVNTFYGFLLYPAAEKLSFGAAAGIGGLMLIVGAALQYGLSVLTYKAPISKRAQLRSLQKYM